MTISLLAGKLPDSLEVDGKPHKIRTDFRHAIKIILSFEDVSLTNRERTIIALKNIFYVVPENVEEAARQVEWFLSGGEADNEEVGNEMRLYSFKQDERFIYAAFQQTHRVDLQAVELHWWTFLALFLDLGKDTTFSQLVTLRKRVKTGKATQEEHRAANEMGDIFRLDAVDDRSLADREEDERFEEAYREARRKRDERRKKQS